VHEHERDGDNNINNNVNINNDVNVNNIINSDSNSMSSSNSSGHGGRSSGGDDDGSGGGGITMPRVNLYWAKLLLFSRKNWSRFRFGDVVVNVEEPKR
jgi:hypothetical protein